MYIGTEGTVDLPSPDGSHQGRHGSFDGLVRNESVRGQGQVLDREWLTDVSERFPPDEHPEFTFEFKDPGQKVDAIPARQLNKLVGIAVGRANELRVDHTIAGNGPADSQSNADCFRRVRQLAGSYELFVRFRRTISGEIGSHFVRRTPPALLHSHPPLDLCQPRLGRTPSAAVVTRSA